MEWYTHPRFCKYEANMHGIVRNKKTKKELKPYIQKHGKSLVIGVSDIFGNRKLKRLGVFILEAVNCRDNIEDCSYLDGNNLNNTYENLQESLKGRKVFQINYLGKIEKVWDNVVQIQDDERYCSSRVRSCCTNHSRTHAGYYWSYKENLQSITIPVLVVVVDTEELFFSSTKQAYYHFKKLIPKNINFKSFDASIYKAKTKGTKAYGYSWNIIEKRVVGYE